MKKLKSLILSLFIGSFFKLYGVVVHGAHYDNDGHSYCGGGWSGEYIVDTSNIWVPPGETLTIHPGTIVKFNKYNNYYPLEFTVYGNLYANGAIFTSNYSPPQPGDWLGINIVEEPGHSMKVKLYNCVIEYGGKPPDWYGAAAVSIRGYGHCNVYISNTTIKYSPSSGIYTEACSLFVSDVNITNNSGHGISNSELHYGIILPSRSATTVTWTIANNRGYPIYSITPQNVLDLYPKLNLIAYGNDTNAIYVNRYGNNPIRRNGTWGNYGVPYVVYSLSVPPGVLLRIEPGVKFEFMQNGSFTVYGKLIANGTSSQKIIFTSHRSNPQPGDWKEIYFYGADSISRLNNCVVEYGGRGASGTINLANSNISILNTEIRKNMKAGIYISQSCPTIRSCKITENLSDGIYIYSVLPVTRPVWILNTEIKNNKNGIYIERPPSIIRSCRIMNNSNHGIYINLAFGGRVDLGTCDDPGNNTIKENGSYNVYNNSPFEISALYNDWGATDSSVIDAKIYDNEENSAKGRVNFIPFLGQPFYGSTAFNNAKRLLRGYFTPSFYPRIGLGYTGMDKKVYFTSSYDAENWRKPISLSSGKYPAMIFRAPRIVVVWVDKDSMYEYLKMSYSEYEAWQPPVILFSTQNTNYRTFGPPSISFDGTNWWITWSAYRDINILPYPRLEAVKVLLVGKFSRLDGSDFTFWEVDNHRVSFLIPLPPHQSPPVPVDTVIIEGERIAIPVPMSPSIAANWGENDVQLLWDRPVPGETHSEIFWYEYKNGEWLKRGFISKDDTLSATAPQIEIFNDYVHAIWQEKDQDGIHKIWWRQRYKNSEIWEPFRPINLRTSRASFDPIILRGEWAVWVEEHSQGVSELWGSRRINDEWTDPVQLTFTGKISLYPQITFKPSFYIPNPTLKE
ncbi:MAG: right-handed parallel beta-helix repeat-containing protein, partial [candidate division WOR-3 bacterium]